MPKQDGVTGAPARVHRRESEPAPMGDPEHAAPGAPTTTEGVSRPVYCAMVVILQMVLVGGGEGGKDARCGGSWGQGCGRVGGAGARVRDGGMGSVEGQGA